MEVDGTQGGVLGQAGGVAKDLDLEGPVGRGELWGCDDGEGMQGTRPRRGKGGCLARTAPRDPEPCSLSHPPPELSTGKC